MSEQNLYGLTHKLSNVRLLKDPDQVGKYHVFVDGKELNGVREMTFHYAADEIPQTDITLNSVPKVDHDTYLSYHFDSGDIRECIKFLAFQLQFDEDLKTAWIMSIQSALDDFDKLEDASDMKFDNNHKAGYILDRLVN